ncbi:MAG TPA: isoprenylcysteine carboxylmethyltransferase family protein [Streptosporangiaceae bacterium]|jgi:protein-S-isoprenylcysteine O-methyltransferase Ste14|nr:isoprenylcysteine carboxylmethyltransferase family protein [Streptosporangiaceae bacterium]
MNAYFDTNHAAAALFTVTIAAWGMMELSQRSQPSREGATKIAGIGGRLVALAFVIATTVVATLTPRVFPAAAIRPGAVAFAAGMVVLLAGLVLRGWSFKALGQYFTHTVMVSSDQPVIASGPYRVLRHPSYTGIILAAIGIGLASANWADLAGLLLLTLTALLWRIRIEEAALMTTLGDRYRAYAAQHKRLVPLVW